MKILLTNGSVFKLDGMVHEGLESVDGFMTGIILMNVIGELDTLKEIFHNKENLSQISVLDDINGVVKEYIGYEKLLGIGFSSPDNEESYEIKLGIHNDGKEFLTKVSRRITEMSEKNSTIEKSMSGMKDEILEAKQQIADLTKPEEEVELSLEELKRNKISETKILLAEYLESQSIESSCHGGKLAHYSITSDKQQYLVSMIAIAEMAQAAGVDYTPSWNARGEVCTYDWTIDELKQLAFEMEGVVRPLISKQQKMENTINTLKTKEEVESFVISYEM